jgi:hypothetical protein
VVANEPENIPPSVMDRVLAEEPATLRFVKPYLRGRTFNSSPTTAPDARIVDFTGCELADLSRVPSLLQLVREHVKPGRDALHEQSGAKQLNPTSTFCETDSF